jgi:hypothetical protein
MQLDISIDEKTLDAQLSFKLSDFKSAKHYKDALAIIMMVAGDYSLDPEMEIEDLEDIVQKGMDEQAQKVIFFINEDEIEAEFAN